MWFITCHNLWCGQPEYVYYTYTEIISGSCVVLSQSVHHKKNQLKKKTKCICKLQFYFSLFQAAISAVKINIWNVKGKFRMPDLNIKSTPHNQIIIKSDDNYCLNHASWKLDQCKIHLMHCKVLIFSMKCKIFLDLSAFNVWILRTGALLGEGNSSL